MKNYDYDYAHFDHLPCSQNFLIWLKWLAAMDGRVDLTVGVESALQFTLYVDTNFKLLNNSRSVINVWWCTNKSIMKVSDNYATSMSVTCVLG